jgi:hypothetical protein
MPGKADSASGSWLMSISVEKSTTGRSDTLGLGMAESANRSLGAHSSSMPGAMGASFKGEYGVNWAGTRWSIRFMLVIARMKIVAWSVSEGETYQIPRTRTPCEQSGAWSRCCAGTA